ncbi:MAG: UDP-3-O-(3-hydroxymyristoyl)glucosamine N-acyltransferase [Terriglobales bacterium]|jgi:UDP-3-O-[3-hydroxymyristoyl] glucosamine N-acyltransferase
MSSTVRAVSEAVHARVVGDGEVVLSRISSIESAAPGDLVFVEDEKNLTLALESRASAVIAGEFAAQKAYAKPLIISTQPRLAFARAARLLYPAQHHQSGVHPTALVHPSVQLGAEIAIDARGVISEDATIGQGTWVGAGTVIGAGVSIGRDCRLHPNVTIYPGTKIGDRVVVHAGAVLGSDGFGYVQDKTTGQREQFPQIGRLEIGDDVEIGANSTIDRGALEVTRIGRGTKIDNLVHIGHNCQIDEDVVIAAQTGLSGSITIEKNVVLGGQVGIGEHARLEEGVMLGGQGGVLPNKILRGKGVAFWGTPAQPVREYLKQLAALARLAKKE